MRLVTDKRETEKKLAMLRKANRVEEVEHGFLKVKDLDRQVYWVDSISMEAFPRMPEISRYGNIEVAELGGEICTRTRKAYVSRMFSTEVVSGKENVFIALFCYDCDSIDERIKHLADDGSYAVCVLEGDTERYYWWHKKLEDESIIVFDEDLTCYYVTGERAYDETGKPYAVKVRIGTMQTAAEEEATRRRIAEINERLIQKSKIETLKQLKREEQEREKKLKKLTTAKPFRMGSKWGLKLNERIVVLPLYRSIKEPVGRYCAVEMYPKRWGVISLDGRVVMDGKYDDVVVLPNGVAVVYSYGGKKERVRISG